MAVDDRVGQTRKIFFIYSSETVFRFPHLCSYRGDTGTRARVRCLFFRRLLLEVDGRRARPRLSKVHSRHVVRPAGYHRRRVHVQERQDVLLQGNQILAVHGYDDGRRVSERHSRRVRRHPGQRGRRPSVERQRENLLFQRSVSVRPTKSST